MAFRRHISPDMNLNDVEFGITYQICQIFDIDRGWEQLAGVIGYSTSSMKQFELETRRPDGSPTKKILWDWGTRGATVRDLYNKLALMSRAHVMRLLEPIMNTGREEGKEKGVKAEKEKEKIPESNDTSVMSGDSMSMPSLKKGNLINRPSGDSLSYNPASLPVPKKQPCKQDDVNINKLGTNALKSSEEKDLKLQSINLGQTEPGAASVHVNECQADGPGSRKGNEGAASSARPCERVKSLEHFKSAFDDYTSQSSNSYVSQLSNEEKEVAIAMMATPNYTYKELSQATDGFRIDHKLGEGKFGAVYLGVVKNTNCAIKKLYQKQERNDENTSSSHLSAELRALSRYHHENIVTLYGYALDGDEVCLVYQYMPNGSLDDCLHQRNGHNVVLDWHQRLNILSNAACGLQYLHSVERKPVIHGDIKSANILLDRHFDAKIGDLGLAQQATGGTVTGELTHITKKTTDTRDYKNHAYYAPEILRGNTFSVKGDTYAFGVVIFECLTGQEAYDEKREGSSEKKLVDYIQSQLEENPKMSRDLLQDNQVEAPCPKNMFLPLFELAENCISRLKKDRPTMVNVFQELERIGKAASLQESEGKSGVCSAKNQNLKRENSEGYSSYLSGSCYTPEVKEGAQVYSPSLIIPQGKAQSQGNEHFMKVTSPIDYLPKNHPVPEAFALQRLHDQKKCEEHVYQNVEKLSKVSINDIPQLTSDPKKLAQLNREESEESNNSDGTTDFRSDPKKMKAIEDFDKGVENSHQTERFPESDPKKVALLMGQDIVLSGKKSAVEVEYENVPHNRYGNREEIEHEGEEQDSEGEVEGECYEDEVEGPNYGSEHHSNEGVSHAEVITEKDVVNVDYLAGDCDTDMLMQLGIASKMQPVKAGMLALFENYEQDIGGSFDFADVGYDCGEEGDDDSESTLTESTCMADFGENETSITEEELFATDTSHDYENYPPKKEATTTTTETITAHRKKFEFYQNVSVVGEQGSLLAEQNDDCHQESAVMKDHIDFSSPRLMSRAPTEDECYEC